MKHKLSSKIFWQKALYHIGIALGLVIVAAFISSHVIYPILLGRQKSIPTPDVTGLRITAARDTLISHRLHAVIRDSIFSDEIPVDVVIDQIPTSGEMSKFDGTVYLTISKGTQFVSVPNVTGQHYESALVMIRNTGLKAMVSDSLYSEEISANKVIRTDPSGGANVTAGKTVYLILSRGPRPVEEAIPEEYPPYR